MSKLHFTLELEPVPKGRARHRIVHQPGREPWVQEYTPKETRDYEGAVRKAAQAEVERIGWSTGKGDTFAVVVRVFRTYRRKGGDLSNVYKAVEDGLNGSGVWLDDRYVDAFGCAFGPPCPENPRIEVTVRKI